MLMPGTPLPLWKRKLLNSSRRGNAEVEMMLTPYVCDLCSPPSDALLDSLLNENDQHLLEWLMSPKQAPSGYLTLIEAIRTHYLQ